MSVKIGKVGQIPNWIWDNDWSAKRRLYWLNQIMAFSSRDWSQYAHATPGYPDAEKWAIWCLVCCDTKEEALKTWYDFCEQYKDTPRY